MYVSSMILVILGWILFGGIVGLLARAIFPGRQTMGVLGTVLLGIAGSFIGGILANLLFGHGHIFVMQTAGWIGSILGALLLLAAITGFPRRRRSYR